MSSTKKADVSKKRFDFSAKAVCYIVVLAAFVGILHSFQFDADTDYKGAQTKRVSNYKKSKSFWDDLLVDVVVYGSIGLVIFLIGVVGSFISKSKGKNNGRQSKDGIEKAEDQQNK